MNRRDLIVGSMLATVECGCGGGAIHPDSGLSVVRKINEFLLLLISTSLLGPPPVARAIAMVTTAMFDAYACYDPVACGTRYGSSLRQPVSRRTLSATVTAIVHAAMHTLIYLFPHNEADIRSMVTNLGENPDELLIGSSSPHLIGYRVAIAIITQRTADGSNAANGFVDTSSYEPVNRSETIVDPARWQPVRDVNGQEQSFTCPHWGNVLPFALTGGSILRPRSIPDFGSATYMAQMNDLLRMMETLDDRKKSIAEYWADGPRSVRPPGHWLLLAMEAARTRALTLRDEIVLYFAVGNAMLDASIACWDSKRHFDSSRPITAIRFLYKGKSVPSYAGPTEGIVWADGSLWKPYQSTKFITPPFPEYTSGHSTFSGAGATVLRKLLNSDDFGMRVKITKGSSSLEHQMPRSDIELHYPTFTSAEIQAGLSRRYGGIHFEAADVEGRLCGQEVGSRVITKVIQFATGTLDTRSISLK